MASYFPYYHDLYVVYVSGSVSIHGSTFFFLYGAKISFMVLKFKIWWFHQCLLPWTSTVTCFEKLHGLMVPPWVHRYLEGTKHMLEFRITIYACWHVYIFAGKFQYRVTEESLMDRLTTDTHATCLLIQKDCRSESSSFCLTFQPYLNNGRDKLLVMIIYDLWNTHFVVFIFRHYISVSVI